MTAPSESAEPIARVIDDLRKGNVQAPPRMDRKLFDLAVEHLQHSLVNGAPVVDATSIYRALLPRKEFHLYEDHPCIAPPWHDAMVCYRNEHGNVIVQHAVGFDNRDPEAGGRWTLDWEPADPVDEDRLRWKISVFLWMGGHGGDGKAAIVPCGPMMEWSFAIYDDGQPADLHWRHLVSQYEMSNWDMANLIMLGTLNFMNCRNVELVDPVRSRAERRRLERLDVRVRTINVFPAGKATRGAKGEPVGGVPLTPVAGHFAKYGPEYGRGLLFGKYAGRFWIPQHARGSSEHGDRTGNDYRLMPDG